MTPHTRAPVSALQVPCPQTGTLHLADILQDSRGFYYRTTWPLLDELRGPYPSIREAKEMLWSIYGRA